MPLVHQAPHRRAKTSNQHDGGSVRLQACLWQVLCRARGAREAGSSGVGACGAFRASPEVRIMMQFRMSLKRSRSGS